ncbi:LLM class flavin-dependent oxidoreductase [Pedobacter sandarakinus]|uniref:LLM class flavin-dependent oxidoreductase n=1 Tax=Pedobacter sandarakinus TaxID=353156 RepID=UPI0022457C06|nr:LLM class flavin-dependent oxidoreductase [Pedobacter sandarakinus]MCX2574913.1 LLM class flavin-dependent oxidoreductase [Pedobacter sandarakinus]
MNNNRLQHIPYSVLDLATVIDGSTAADTFKASLQVAQQSEALGYKRYWFAEHHNMAGVASSATSILIGHVAGGTKSIRVGSGGIMLPNHAPLIVAEQFGTLASLYPNRIDLGLGRAPGTDQVTAMAIRGENFNAAHYFPKDVEKLQQLFSADNLNASVRAIPGEGLEIPIWILGSSTDSARLAAAKGLPYAFASHFAPTYFEQAIAIYKDNFKPSATLSAPYVMACVNVVAADTDEQADFLSSSVKRMFLGVITGKREKLKPPFDNINNYWDRMEKEAVEQMLYYSFIGGKESIRQNLTAFVDKYGVNEIMSTSHIYDLDAKLHSNKLLAEIFVG